mmetsp:Transcript_11778/g.49355  ORF Transcript_11778/g.49355 Transcript_11778/m.49355 type:complete len:201 (-) Transcript_11778:1100-1702(-)
MRVTRERPNRPERRTAPAWRARRRRARRRRKISSEAVARNARRRNARGRRARRRCFPSRRPGRMKIIHPPTPRLSATTSSPRRSTRGSSRRTRRTRSIPQGDRARRARCHARVGKRTRGTRMDRPPRLQSRARRPPVPRAGAWRPISPSSPTTPREAARPARRRFPRAPEVSRARTPRTFRMAFSLVATRRGWTARGTSW